MKGETPPTMQRIAKAAGVSVATVSLCLRNHPRFPQETRERIQGIAREMGYRPNPMVSTLMAHLRSTSPPQYTATIGFIDAVTERDTEPSPTVRGYMAGARARAEQMGYRVDEFRIREPGMTSARLNRILRARGIVGLVIGPVSAGRGHLSLDWSGVAAAAIGYSMWRPDLHRIVHNQFRAMSLVMRQLYKLGYRRIGLTMSSNFDERVDHHWLAALLTSNRQQSDVYAVPPHIPKSWNAQEFGNWYRKHQPDVVVSPQYAPYDWLGALGARVPRDVGFVHLDVYPEFGIFSGIDQRSEIVGAAAVDAVVGQLHRNEHGIPADPKLVLLDGRWVQGGTVRKMPVRPVAAKTLSRKVSKGATEPKTAVK